MLLLELESDLSSSSVLISSDSESAASSTRITLHSAASSSGVGLLHFPPSVPCAFSPCCLPLLSCVLFPPCRESGSAACVLVGRGGCTPSRYTMAGSPLQ